jgi:hypothetical protein
MSGLTSISSVFSGNTAPASAAIGKTRAASAAYALCRTKFWTVSHFARTSNNAHRILNNGFIFMMSIIPYLIPEQNKKMRRFWQISLLLRNDMEKRTVSIADYSTTNEISEAWIPWNPSK